MAYHIEGVCETHIVADDGHASTLHARMKL